MVDPWDKSKRRSSGKSARKPHNYTFYLDECFDCPQVTDVLYKRGVSYRIYRQDVPAGVGIGDDVVLPHARNRIFITSDAKQRHRRREQFEIKKRKMRHFSLPANLSAEGKAELISRCLNKIRQFCRDHEAPFSAAITKSGTIELRMDKHGNIHGREEE